MANPDRPRSRADRRRQTETRIAAAARDLFARLGYERSTIRAIAQAAGVDPGLVMHYFGSKQQLFAHAAAHAEDELAGDTPGAIADSMLEMLRDRLDDEPVASLAVLRSMLTHGAAADTYERAAATRLEQVIAAIPTTDAPLRASLLSAIIQGVLVERWLLGRNSLTDASPEEIIELLRPCFELLFGAPHARADLPGKANRPPCPAQQGKR